MIEIENPYFMKAERHQNVSVIGACGRIGLPLTYIIARSGYQVYGIDPQTSIGQSAKSPSVAFPYMEKYLESELMARWKPIFERVEFTNLYTPIEQSNVIVVVVGTPVDGENNPRVENIIDLFKKVIIPRIGGRQERLIILRSTVYPGMTDLIKKMIEEANPGWEDGINYYLVFAPERISQGNSIAETPVLPQLIGAYTQNSYKRAEAFFENLGCQKTIRLTPKEAEYGKLITNMYRYVNIAFANEMYMIGAKEGVDTHKVIEAANLDYPRMNMPLPGPNAAGPCLFKDGKLLVDDVPYGDLINVSFHINEGMPKFMYRLMEDKAEKTKTRVRKVAIYGMAFKPENDDIRFSESYKLSKILKRKGLEIFHIDKYVQGTTPLDSVPAVDAIFIMTPHNSTREDIRKLLQKCKDDCIIIDGWKKLNYDPFPVTRMEWDTLPKNGVYTKKEFLDKNDYDSRHGK